jgi:prepilin-type N-terminal cleavage/methylation domain-containing protein
MPRHHHRQSLSRGFTLPELLVGVLIMGVAALVGARMVGALAKGARYTVRQSAVLADGRRALLNTGKNRGLVWAAQEASAVRSLSTATLQLVVQGPVNADFEVVGSSVLVKTEGGSAVKQAPDISSMTVSYFEIGSDGLIFQSTVASQASLVQFVLRVKGKTSKERTYNIVSGAWLRNR